MLYVEAPAKLENLARPFVFLAGGIVGCEEWQTEVSDALCRGYNKGTVLNPRRKNFPINDPMAAREQIGWEHGALWTSDVISYWFAGGESVQPIVMFELGCHLGRYCIGGGPLRLVVGVDPKYVRKADVEIQLEMHSRTLNGQWVVGVTSHTLKGHVESILNAVRSLG